MNIPVRSDNKRDGQLDSIVRAIVSAARLEFTEVAEITDAGDRIDAIAAGINMLVEELKESVVSKDRLQKSEEKYRSLYEGSIVGKFRVNISTQRPVAANGKVAQMFGYGSVAELMAEFKVGDHYRNPEERDLMLHLVSMYGEVHDYELEFVRKDGTDGNDWAYDAPKLNVLGELSLYSYMEDGLPLAIQGYGAFAAERIVPLGLNSDFQTTVTIALDSTENMPTEDIILEDRHLGIFNDLRTAPYTVQVAAMSYDDRFFLHFAPQLLTGVDRGASVSTMFAHIANDQLHVRATGDLVGELRMFDMSGKMVLRSPIALYGSEPMSMDVSSLARGVYTVMVQNDAGTQVRKVIR